MAKIVIAGAADCPYYAKIELLADKLVKNLPDFNIHKIVIQPNEWETWLENTCEEREWRHHRSPIVWRELVDRGGKGMLIGSANEFQEYIHGYYGIVSDSTSIDMRLIGQENAITKEAVDEELRMFKALSNPIHVCFTNANSQTVYNMISAICNGEAFGENTEISLRLLTSEEHVEQVKGVAMEAFDLSCRLLRKTMVTSDPTEAFRDCTAVIITDEIIRTKNSEGDFEETEESWLQRNADVFTRYAKCLDCSARKDVRVIIASHESPINFNATVLSRNSKKVSKQNIVGISRTVERRAKAVLSQRLGVNSAHIVDVLVWGNVNRTNYIQTTNSRVHLYDGAIWGPPWYSRSIAEMVHDDKWMATEYLSEIKNRRSMIESALSHSASLSLATSVVTSIDHWWNGSPPGQQYSLTVCSQGWYEIPEDIFFSFPVTMGPPGYWSVVQDIELNDENREALKNIAQELQSELDLVYPPTKPPTPAPSVHDSDRHSSQSHHSSIQASDEQGSQTGSQGGSQDNESIKSDSTNKKVFGEAAEAMDQDDAEDAAEEQPVEE